jgi:hypothetical protein
MFEQLFSGHARVWDLKAGKLADNFCLIELELALEVSNDDASVFGGHIMWH